MAGDIHKGGLTRLFPYDFLVEQEGSMYVARAAKRGYIDLVPNGTLATLCQQIVTALDGVGSFFLKILVVSPNRLAFLGYRYLNGCPFWT